MTKRDDNVIDSQFSGKHASDHLLQCVKAGVSPFTVTDNKCV